MANLCEHYHHLDLACLRRQKLLTPVTRSIEQQRGRSELGAAGSGVPAAPVRADDRPRMPWATWQGETPAGQVEKEVVSLRLDEYVRDRHFSG
jgi:hypothetical protein